MKLERKIEKAIMSNFPGSKIKFTINKDGSWNLETLKGSKDRFDELYPGMSREQADAKILVDIEAIIRQFLPTTEFVGYERYGQYNRFQGQAERKGKRMHFINKAGLIILILSMFMISDKEMLGLAYYLFAVGTIAFFVDLKG